MVDGIRFNQFVVVDLDDGCVSMDGAGRGGNSSNSIDPPTVSLTCVLMSAMALFMQLWQ